jgi:hypothetical protein
MSQQVLQVFVVVPKDLQSDMAIKGFLYSEMSIFDAK